MSSAQPIPFFCSWCTEPRPHFHAKDDTTTFLPPLEELVDLTKAPEKLEELREFLAQSPKLQIEPTPRITGAGKIPYNVDFPIPLPELVVTRNGVPVPDQAAGLREFAAACNPHPKNAFFQEPIPTFPNLTTTMPGHPLAKLAVTLLQPTDAGYTLILGFPTKLDAMKAQDWLFDQIKANTLADPDEVLQLANRLGKINKSIYGGGNCDYMDAVEMLVDCSDSIAALGMQIARHHAELATLRNQLGERDALIARLRPLAPLAFHVLEKQK